MDACTSDRPAKSKTRFCSVLVLGIRQLLVIDLFCGQGQRLFLAVGILGRGLLDDLPRALCHQAGERVLASNLLHQLVNRGFMYHNSISFLDLFLIFDFTFIVA